MKNLIRLFCLTALFCCAMAVFSKKASAQARCLDAPQRCEQVTGRRVLGLRPNNPTNYCATTDALPSATHCVNDEYFMGPEGSAFTGVTQVNCTGMMRVRCASRGGGSSASHGNASLSVRGLRNGLSEVKRMLALYIQRQIDLERQVQRQGARLEAAEGSIRLLTSQIGTATDTLVALLANDEQVARIQQLAMRQSDETDDVAASERVGAYLTELGADFRAVVQGILRNNGRASLLLTGFGRVTVGDGFVAGHTGVNVGVNAAITDDGDTQVAVAAILGVGGQTDSPHATFTGGVEGTVIRMLGEHVGIGAGASWRVAGTLGVTDTTHVTGLTLHEGAVHGRLRFRSGHFIADLSPGAAYTRAVIDVPATSTTTATSTTPTGMTFVGSVSVGGVW